MSSPRKGRVTPTPEQHDRDLHALELRRQGLTYREIAERIDCAVPTAYKAVRRALAYGFTEPAEHVRQLETERLDKLQAVHWRNAIDGDTKSTEIVLRIMERRARLLGLDAPTRTNVTVSLDQQQAHLIVDVIRGILTDLHLTEEQDVIAGEIVSRHLRRIDNPDTDTSIP